MLRGPAIAERDQYLKLLRHGAVSRKWIIEDLLASQELHSLERRLRVVYGGQVITEPGSSGQDVCWRVGGIPDLLDLPRPPARCRHAGGKLAGARLRCRCPSPNPLALTSGAPDGCDAGHTIQHACNDLHLVQEVLVPGGIVALDDHMSVHWPGVTEGFYRFMYTQNRRLKPLYTSRISCS